MNAPLALAEAQARLLGAVAPLEIERVPAADAIGRLLAEPLVAARRQPAADLSSMDGYAGAGSGPWTIVGESAAGRPFAQATAAGEAVRISTGAAMPEGAAVVLLQEQALRDGDRLAANAPDAASARYIRRAGFDFAPGDVLAERGARIGPTQLALALAGGAAELAVHRRPTLAVLDSGDELATDPANCRPHQVPASNGAMIAAMAAPFVASVRRIGPVPDSLDALGQALAGAEGADVLVTSGGASVGDHDLIRPALEAWGATIDFWRVAMKPGKPLLVARRGHQTILGLPGNPVSSYVTAFLCALPLLRRLGGASVAQATPRRTGAILGAPLEAGGDRHELVRGHWADECVAPLPEQDSSALRSLAAAELLIDRPPHAPALAAGAPIAIYPLENGGIA
jgi:molybdopterin molybdotransferase